MAPAFASTEFQSHNFFRPLDWRLVAAQRRLSGKRPRRRRHPLDPVVDRLTGILKAEANPKKSGKAAKLNTDRVAWRQAVQLRDAGGPLRLEVEARLLAGQSDEEIGALCRLSPEVVHWYEACLFNVRDRLGSSTWVAARVIGMTFPAGDIGPVLKHFAFTHGPVGLDLVLAVHFGLPLPPAATAEFSQDRAYQEQRLRFLVRLNVAILQAATPAELLRLVDEYEQAQQIDRRRTDVPTALNSDLRSSRAILGLTAQRSKRKSKAAKSPSPAANKSAGNNQPDNASRSVPTPVVAERQLSKTGFEE
jgi:hypothetical protein